MNVTRCRNTAGSFVACVTLSVLLSLVSCSTQDELHTQTPPVILAESFSASGEEVVPAKWWTVFHDDNLNVLIERSLNGNMSLRSTWDRLDQARAVARASGAEMYPSLDLNAGASRNRNESEVQGTTYQSTIVGTLVAGYEVDLWGRIRSTQEAAALDALASQEDLRAAGISLTAQVAETWYQLIEQRGQLNLLDKQIKTNEEFLEMITLRFRRGQVPATDVLQQEQALESTRGERLQVVANIGVLTNQLAVLMGQSPGTVELPDVQHLPDLPALPRTGVPAEWLRQRPDIRSAYLSVHAADKRVSAAIANRFPKVSLSAQGGSSTEHVRDLFDNWLASIAANLVAPVLDGGQRSAEVDRTRAVASERFHSYGQVVLESLAEVEDALSREARQQERLESLHKQLDLSRKSADQTRERYTKGTEDFLSVLTTLLSYQKLQRTVLSEARTLIQYRISLYRALGCGWEMTRPTDRSNAIAKNGH